MSRGQREKRGVWVCSYSSPPCLTARVGAEGAGLDRGDAHEHGYRAEAKMKSVSYSELIFSDFCSPGVRHNACKNSNFAFFENGHCGLSRYFTRIPDIFLLS
jgi:hypothetical protein